MKKVSIGVDAGSRYLKIVCLKHGEGAPILVGYGILKHEGDIRKMASHIRNWRLPRGDVRVNIEDKSMKIRRADLPMMDEEEIPEAIKWSMKDIVSGDIDDYVFRHVLIHADDLVVEGRIPVIAFAISKKAVEERMEFVKKIGLPKPSIVEPNAAAIAALFFFNAGYGSGDIVLVDIGHSIARFLVMGKKGLLFSRPMECSAGEVPTGKDLTSFFSKMAVEIQRSIDGYSLIFQGRQIKQMFLCGGGSRFQGIADYMSETLGVKTAIFDAFKFIDTGRYGPGQLDKVRMLVGVSCGLAVD